MLSPADQLRDQLRESGLRVTAQRLAVLHAVPGDAHVTADEVAETVRSRGGSISVQGVYDALAALVEVGLVRRIQPAGSPALFEARTGDNHHHVICRSCGSIGDIDCAVGLAPCLDAAGLDAGASGYQIDEAEVTFWGRCPSCASDDP